ncbi:MULTISPECIES: hypothetical protein [unclassified Solwaraspora]|uniref:hypothetical protein n=1 Tax=unclassified Solwaraspora TaxID=2627926 RepID=UPI00259B04BC|nr:hypothetical protein [Solwaraspora sp. WMMA2056]WJK43101.1 hypothetical protein O7608_12320 [Solwaraspora sp. WMMA2056]
MTEPPPVVTGPAGVPGPARRTAARTGTDAGPSDHRHSAGSTRQDFEGGQR